MRSSALVFVLIIAGIFSVGLCNEYENSQAEVFAKGPVQNEEQGHEMYEQIPRSRSDDARDLDFADDDEAEDSDSEHSESEDVEVKAENAAKEETKNLEVQKNPPPSSAQNSKQAELDQVNTLHQNLVSQVLANQQQKLLQYSTPTPHSPQNDAQSYGQLRYANSISASNPGQSQTQLVAQNPSDGQFYSLTPIKPQEAAQIQAQQLQASNAQSLQAQQIEAAQAQQLQSHQLLQARVQQLQATQLQQLQAQLNSNDDSRATPGFRTPGTNQEPQFFTLSAAPQDQAVQYVNPPQFVLQSPNQSPFFQLFSNQPQPEIFQPFQPQRKVVVQQTVLTPQSFTVGNNQQGLAEAFSDSNMEKLVTEVGLRYTPIEDTAQYTVYRVKDPEFGLPLLKPRQKPPTQNQNFQTQKSIPLEFNSLPAPVRPTSKPIKILPASAIGFNYRPKAVNPPKPQVVYKSAVDPEYYNAVKSKLISSFSSSNQYPFATNSYSTTPTPAPKPVNSPKYRNQSPFRSIDFIGSLRNQYERRKPFRPSPVDLGGFYAEPLFESADYMVGQPTISKEQTVHPPRFHSKYVDIDYSPGVSLPANEAAFAAMQARKVGGPAFIDPGFLTSALGFELNGKILEPLYPNNEAPSLRAQPHVHELPKKRPDDLFRFSPPSQQQRGSFTPRKNPSRPSAQGLGRVEFPKTQSQRPTVPARHISQVEFQDIDVSRQPIVPPHVLSQLLKSTTQDDAEFENYF